ncbi:hypothetical protein ACIBF5_21660 [Micromonospora sp. NPDC050417]|uniref:hypothetical protein n=1 Tax=Micromonospora sp. NPDC050417 TaxID=3364280 RepID=UPI00379BB46C
MSERPTDEWRRDVREEAEAIRAGTLTQEEAYAAELWPSGFITAVDGALDAYEADVRAFRTPSDEEVLVAVQRVVLALNAIDEEHGNIETGEREQLCEYVDDVLTAAGIDVGALTARRGIDRTELTDSWRDW